MIDLGQIDFAIRSYKDQLEDSEYERLLFFRDLWEIQADAAKQHAEEIAFTVPKADELKALSVAGTPVLSEFPAQVAESALVDTVAKIASRMSAFEQFDESARSALANVSWERMVAASDVTLAGKDPVAYVDAFDQLLVDDGLNENSARIGASAVALALRALLQKASDEIQAARRDNDADQPYPTNCPVCGSTAAVARVGGGGKTKGRSRTLWCAQCGCVWDIERVRCARCGTQNQGHLHFFNVEGDDNHRIATCDECGGYIRTVYEEDDPLKNLYPFNFEVEDVIMARLDLIAYRQLVAQEAQER